MNTDLYAFDRLTKHYKNELSRNHSYIIWYNSKIKCLLLIQQTFTKLKNYNNFILVEE